MKSLDKETFQNQAYEHLKKAILDGEIREDEVHSESSFANILGVSRTPVREAVLKLKQEGLLETLPSRGVIVKVLTPDEIAEIFGLRRAIEGFSVIRLTETVNTENGRMTIKNLKNQLAKQVHIIDKSGSFYDAMICDDGFHFEIVKAAGYNKLITQMHDLSARIRKIGIRTFGSVGRSEQAIQEHRDLLAKIEEGDCYGAFSALQVHLDRAEALVINSI